MVRLMLRRGDVWEVSGQRPAQCAGGVARHVQRPAGYPDRADDAGPGRTGDDLGTWCVPIGAGEVAIVDQIGRTAKAVFERRVRVVGSQVVMDVNNALFTILSTN
jgi:hypothetical protein